MSPCESQLRIIEMRRHLTLLPALTLGICPKGVGELRVLNISNCLSCVERSWPAIWEVLDVDWPSGVCPDVQVLGKSAKSTLL